MTFNRFLCYCALLTAVAYSTLTFYPNALFGNIHKAANISLHSRVPLPEASQAIIARVRERIAACDFFDPEQKFDIYFTGDSPLYALLAPFCRKSFSCLHPVSDKIFIASPDFENNLAHSPGGAEAPRILESVIMHELIKAQVKHRVGGPNYLFLSEMKKEGYAEHITMETAELQPTEICTENIKFATVRHYLEQRLVLEMVQRETDTAYTSLIRNNQGDDSAVKRLRQTHCK